MAFAGPRQSILGPRPAPGLDPPGQRLPRRASACRRSRMFRSTGHRPPPGEAKALSPLQWQGPLPLPQRHADPWPAGGQSPRPAPDPPMAGASPPPGRALASVLPGPAGLQGTVPHGRGKRGSRFLAPPAPTKALSPRQWQGPSPLPQRHADPCPAGGPIPPASARPAPGGRVSPAGSGAGLCPSRTCRPAGHDPGRRGTPFPRNAPNVPAAQATGTSSAPCRMRPHSRPGPETPLPHRLPVRSACPSPRRYRPCGWKSPIRCHTTTAPAPSCLP